MYVLCRVTPVYMMVIVLVIFVVPHVGSGPLWPELARYNQHCHTHWWTNLLYINNLVHADQMVGPACMWSGRGWRCVWGGGEGSEGMRGL